MNPNHDGIYEPPSIRMTPVLPHVILERAYLDWDSDIKGLFVRLSPGLNPNHFGYVVIRSLNQPLNEMPSHFFKICIQPNLSHANEMPIFSNRATTCILRTNCSVKSQKRFTIIASDYLFKVGKFCNFNLELDILQSD